MAMSVWSWRPPGAARALVLGARFGLRKAALLHSQPAQERGGRVDGCAVYLGLDFGDQPTDGVEAVAGDEGAGAAKAPALGVGEAGGEDLLLVGEGAGGDVEVARVLCAAAWWWGWWCWSWWWCGWCWCVWCRQHGPQMGFGSALARGFAQWRYLLSYKDG